MSRNQHNKEHVRLLFRKPERTPAGQKADLNKQKATPCFGIRKCCFTNKKILPKLKILTHDSKVHMENKKK